MEHLQVVHAFEKRLHVVAPQIGHQHAKRGEMARRARNNYFPDRQFFRHRRGVQRSAAAVGNQRKIARVEAALERHVTHRVGHRRGGDLQHPRGRTFEIYVKRLRDPFAQRFFRGASIQAHFATEKALGREPAEDNVRIRDRRFAAAASVARRPGFRAGAARTDVQTAAFIEPRDAAAAGAHFDDVENGNTHREPFVVAADEVIRRQARLAAPNDAGFGGRSAHIERDRGVEIEQFAERHRADHAPGRSRFHHLNALAPRHVDVGQAAVGLHDHEIAAKFVIAQPSFEITQVLAYFRSDVGVGRDSRSAFVFAIFARQLVGRAQK